MHIIYLASSVFLLLPLLIDSFPNTPPTWPSSLGDSLVDSPSKRTLAQAPSEPILQIANATQVLPTSPLSPETPYTVEGTPVILNIATRDPLIPKIYLFASLTSVLRTIAPNVQDKPDDQIPGNRYVAYSRSSASGVGFVYIGTAAPRWLTWQELSWTLQGLLRFANKDEDNCKAMIVRVGIIEEGTLSRPIFGILALNYNDPAAVGEQR